MRCADVGRVGVLSVLYVATARVGLALDAVGGVAAPIWPPSGLALAALVLYGPRLWPGIAVGAFLVNLLVGAPVLVAGGIAVGNTLEALVGAVLLARVVGFRPALARLQDALGLVGLAAGLSTLVSATLGVTSAWLGGLLPPAASGPAWLTWWLGDALGDLVVAPLGFVWSRRGHGALTRRWRLEALGLLGAVGTLSLLVFAVPAPALLVPRYLLFAVLILVALRLGPPGAVTALALRAAIGLWGTTQGWGPFVEPTRHESLVALQTVLSVLAVTNLLVAAAMTERQQAAETLQHTSDALAQLAQERAVALQEREVLLKEVHHRVKNNLQIIASLLSLQADTITDPALRAPLQDSQERVHAMALVHETLYQSQNLAQLEMAPYIHTLGTQLWQAYEGERRHIALRCQVDALGLALEQAMPCGLILTELLTNAFKYAFPPPQGGTIHVALHRVPAQQARLVVRDTGVGLPADLDWRHPGTLGLQLVEMLTEQLGGTLTFERLGGTTCTLTFPVLTPALPPAPRGGEPAAGVPRGRAQDASRHV